MAAIYAHPLEHVLSNMLPILLGPIIMRSHLFVYWIWQAVCITGTMINHSCYCLPGMGQPTKHDFHHYVQEENYGVLGLADRLHQTDREYQRMLEILESKYKQQS
jgi:sterol desaturase/sphingolipid hydroxylase (fatty acid hydroxylase superfamily)